MLPEGLETFYRYASPNQAISVFLAPDLIKTRVSSALDFKLIPDLEKVSSPTGSAW